MEPYPAAAVAAPRASARAAVPTGIMSLVADVEWTPAYVAFLVYIGVVTTLTVPIADVAMGAALLFVFTLEAHRLRFPTFLRYFALLLVWALFGATQSAYQGVVWPDLTLMAKLFAIAFVGVNVLRTRAQIRFFLWFFLACFMLFPVRGVLFNYFLYHSMTFNRSAWKGTFANPNDVAAMMLLQVSLLASATVAERDRTLRLAALSGLGLTVLAIMVTQSRAAFIGLLAFALGAMAFQTGRTRWRIALVGIGVAVMAVMFAPSSAWERFGRLRYLGQGNAQLSAVDAEGSADQRYEIWRVARTIIAEHPLFGVGIGAYSKAHGVYAFRPQFRTTARGERDAHSTYFRMGAETGVLGLVFFLLMLWAPTRLVRELRRRQPEAATTIAALRFIQLGLLAFCVAGIWGSYGNISFTYVHLALLWTTAAGALAQAKRGFQLP